MLDKRVRRLLCAIALLTLAYAGLAPRVPSEAARAADDPRFERVASVVTEKMKEYRVPGVALGIWHAGQTATRGFGVTNLDHPLPVTDDTLFQVGSISKTFTGTLVMRLVETGKLRLDALARSYIPTFRVKDETASREATLLTMLTHMGGWEGDYFDDTGNGDDALARIVERMAHLEQVAPFGTLWSYNNAGFYAAARLVELATGKPYEQALRELLLDPLGLERTFIFPTDVMTYRFAVGHGGPADKLTVLRPWPLARAAHGVGGVTASIKDLLRYGQFHVGDGTTSNGTRILTQTSMQQMQATQVVKHGTDDEMAITWHISNAGSVRQVSHGGSTLGQQALLTLIPSRQLIVALLTNAGRGGQLNRDVTRAAIREYIGVAITDPEPIATPDAELRHYEGKYGRPYTDVIVSVENGRLMIQSIQKQGFPTPSTPIPPPQPSAPYAFYAKDRLIAVGGPTKGARGEILRLPDGSIGWIRVGSRVNRRVSRGTTVERSTRGRPAMARSPESCVAETRGCAALPPECRR